MNIPDAINSGFELFGGGMVFANCRRLRIDRQVEGVSVVGTMLFASWGVWNLFYYWHLEQWASWCGGVLIVLGNFVWVAMALRFRDRC